MSYYYELLVIGSGPAGQKAAIQAAKLGRSVAVVERSQLGGVSVNWGTIPSKTLREGIVYLTGLSQRSTYGQSYRVKEEITIEDLHLRTKRVIEAEVDVVRHQLLRNHVRDLGVVFRLGEEVTAVDRHDGGALTSLASGKQVAADVVVYAAGRQGETDDLGLDAAGLEADARGRIAVGPDFRTAVDHIYAAGDVIGGPALAATSMEQG